MTTDFEHALPTPRPLCAIFEPLLALYVWDELDVEQMESVRAHLETDAYCQYQLQQYQTAIAALRVHVAADDGSAPRLDIRLNGHTTGGEASIRLTLEDIMQASKKSEAPVAPAERPTSIRQFTPRQRQLTALGAIAAVLVLTVLAASLFAYFGSRGVAPAGKPTPTHGLDAQSQAYVNVLETYYAPLGQTFGQEVICEVQGRGASASAQPSIIQSCQVQEAAIVNDAQAFANHLTLPPPTRWQTADTQLKQANQAMISSYDDSVKATTPSEWTATLDADQAAEQLYCAPISQVNMDLVQAGFPLSNLLSVPSSPVTTLCPNHA